MCLARWGLTKTTLEDVAREAGCGRATIYRAFQGGKSEVMAATLAGEVDRFRREVGQAIDAVEPDDLDDVVVAGVVAAARFLRSHDALRYLLVHEPDVSLPWVSFHRIGVLYGMVGDFACATSPGSSAIPRPQPAPPSGSPRWSSATWSTRRTVGTSPIPTRLAGSCPPT